MVKVQWYPGHMEKARRDMIAKLKRVDMVIEIRDGRMPFSSANPVLAGMIKDKPRLIVLAKADLADAEYTGKWLAWLAQNEAKALAVDLMHDPHAAQKIMAAGKDVLKPLMERSASRGIRSRSWRALAAGIPNVGKSTLINRLAGKNVLKAADKPGVTRSLVWMHCGNDFDLLDSPGVLWPRFADEKTGILLAGLGSINDDILDKKEIALAMMKIIEELYPGHLARTLQAKESDQQSLLEKWAVRRGIIAKDKEPDLKRAADAFLTDLRKGRLGCLTLERCDE